MKGVHLVVLQPPQTFAGIRRLLRWDKPRAITDNEGNHAKKILPQGMVCELDDADLPRAHELCNRVTIIASKTVDDG